MSSIGHEIRRRPHSDCWEKKAPVNFYKVAREESVILTLVLNDLSLPMMAKKWLNLA